MGGNVQLKTLALAVAMLFSVPPGNVAVISATALDSKTSSQTTCVSADGWSACFAPNTPPDQMNSAIARLRQRLDSADYVASSRWTNTSTNGSTPTGPVTLTFSFVPDVNTGDPDTTNNLHATLDAQFGSRAAWQNIFRDMFEDWSQHSGLTFVETSDDGAAWPNSPGVVGVRGDIRIVAQPIDGAFGTLAFNYFPNFGDMTIDSGENWADSANGYRFMRNTLMHELGHGLGLDHVIPLDNTKLMEPFLNTNFVGPQDDDVRGAQRQYGDMHEPNASAGAAENLGMVSGAEVADGSLNRSNDVDWYSVQVSGGMAVEATAAPVGSSYNVGPDGGSAQPVNTLAVQRLRIRIYAANGTTLLAEEAAATAGDEVSAAAVAPAGATQVLIQVSSAGGSDDVQRYTMAFVSGGGTPVLLSVSAQADSSVTVDASPADQGGNTTVVAGGTLTYFTSQTVTLTAPPTAGSQRFVRWRLDGAAQPLGQRAITFTMHAARAAAAQYSDSMVVEVSGPSLVVQGDSAVLTATAVAGQEPYQFTWSPADGLSSTTGTSTNAAPSGTTTYTVTVQDNSGATANADFTLTVVPPLSASAGPDRVVPIGSSFAMQGGALGGTPPYTFQWSPATNLTSSTDPVTQVNALIGRTYTLTVTDAAAAIATDTMILAIAPALTVSMPADATVVRGNTVTLTPAVSGGAAPYQYAWSSDGAALSNEQSPTVSPSATTVYELQVQDAAGQTNGGTVQVTVIDTLAVQASASSASVRRGDSVQLTGTITGGRAPFAVTWSPADTIGAPTSLSTSAAPTQDTTFTLSVSDADGQSASSSVAVTVNSPVSGQQAGGDTTMIAPVMGPCGLTSTASCLLLMAGVIAGGRRRRAAQLVGSLKR